MEINSKAPIISRHEITISAPLETAWRVHTQIDSLARLESWHCEGQPYRTNCGRDGLSLGNRGNGNSFDYWRSFAAQETCLERRDRGVLGVHVWNFSATTEGTHVRTEESWEGVSLPAQTKGIQDALDASENEAI